MDRTEFDDFTTSSYEQLLHSALERYVFSTYPEALEAKQDRPHILWRHDVDVSVHRGLDLAKREAALGIQATYFFLLHSPFYTLLEKPIAVAVEQILGHGHRLGLHFDLDFYPPSRNLSELEDKISFEAEFLSRVFGVTPEAVSFHNPEIGNALAYDQDRLAGLVNTYGRQLRSRFDYVSDSNGYWRFRRMSDVIASGEGPLHVLTHPEWWVEQASSPRERISRAIDGRATGLHRWYDEALLTMGRKNVR